MSIDDKKCNELLSNILQLFDIKHLCKTNRSSKHNLKLLLLHPSFIEAFCNLHNCTERSIIILLEIVSAYIDNENIRCFYQNEHLNDKVIYDFNLVLVNYKINIQLFKENFENLIIWEKQFLQFLIELYDILNESKRCKDIKKMKKLYKKIVDNIDKFDERNIDTDLSKDKNNSNIKTESKNNKDQKNKNQVVYQKDKTENGEYFEEGQNKLDDRDTFKFRDKKYFFEIYPVLIEDLKDVFYTFISRKEENCRYYISALEKDKYKLSRLKILVKSTTSNISKNINDAFMIPIVHFFSYHKNFEKLQNNSFKSDKTLSFLIKGFTEMTRTVNNQMRTDKYEKLYAKKRDKIEKIEVLESNDTGDIKLILESEFTFRRNHGKFLLLFFRNGFAIISINSHKYVFLEYINYSTVTKSKVYKEKQENMIKIVYKINVKEMIVIPVDSLFKTKTIIELIQMKERKITATSSNKYTHPAKICFGDLLFLIQYNTEDSLEIIKKRIIARVGMYFFEGQRIHKNKIDLNLYTNFFFFVRHDGCQYLLENEDDLKASLMLTNYKLDIVIKNKCADFDFSNVT